MIRFNLYEFCVHLLHLRERRRALREWSHYKGESTTLLSEAERGWVKSTLELLQTAGEGIGLGKMVQRINEIKYRLEGVTPDCTYQIILTAIEDLDMTIISDLKLQSFAYVPSKRAEYFEQESLFGDSVKGAFPSAAEDIKEAGNSFAAGIYTGCVFYLMRAVEVGLRALAKDLKIKFPDPIEYQEWNTIIDKIQSEANKRCDGLAGRKAKAAARGFYNGAVGEFRAFKDAWRNHVMHARDSYDEGQAQSAMNHVREFMQRLAEKLSEGRKTPVRWK